MGCPYPIKKTGHGYFFKQSGVNQIKSDLLILLLTNPKERCMHPDFGTPLRKLLFEPADKILVKKVRDVIVAALTKWEPRVSFKDINVSLDPENSSVSVELVFRDPENIKDIEVLTLQLPLGEGAL
jgi:phage baseplate assembly protein W